MSMLKVVAFDADDTLWHNERYFRMTQDHFADLLADHTDRATLMARLLQAERRNLGHYGFGIKGFVLSMIETALDVTGDAVPGAVIRQLLQVGQEMLQHPIELLPHARAAVEAAKAHHVLLITKGDLLDQERKLAQSGLGDLFNGVEIVSDKTAPVYAEILARHGFAADQAMMVGNSMKSDVVPIVELGGWGVFVPHGLEWELEAAPKPVAAPRFHEIPDLRHLPALIRRLT